MGAATVTHEFKSTIPALRMYKAQVLERSAIFPNIMPGYTCHFIHGDGGPDSISLTSSYAATSDVLTMKHRVEAVDPANFYAKYALIEGGPLEGSDVLESIANEVKIEAADDGGCVVKTTFYYYGKGGDPDLSEISYGRKTLDVDKIIEDYLLANPTVCA